jgi:hypothetical protein
MEEIGIFQNEVGRGWVCLEGRQHCRPEISNFIHGKEEIICGLISLYICAHIDVVTIWIC